MPDTIYHVEPGKHAVFHPQPGIRLSLLQSGSRYQAFLIEAEVGVRFQAAPHEGEELRYVISGTVTFTVGVEEYVVPAGGTLRHPSSVIHGFHTEGDRATFVTFARSRDYDIARLFQGMKEGG